MKQIENNFVVSGIVGKDAQIRQFTTSSLARFSLAVSRTEKNGDEPTRVTAFLNVEAWRKNENTSSFELLTKGAHVTINGFFKPDEYTDAEGVKHNRIILVATHIYETPDKAE
ncbi:MAG: single-stranded DNA-binding protein [Bacteroidales bacterium]|nr:single-stranded DNA-binding protein [Bacteroidales bacterium]